MRFGSMERKTRFELATTTLGRWRSTVELLSRVLIIISLRNEFCKRFCVYVNVELLLFFRREKIAFSLSTYRVILSFLIAKFRA